MAVERPMPLVAPVMMMTLSVKVFAAVFMGDGWWIGLRIVASGRSCFAKGEQPA
jgi:hypothetical protein